MGPTVLTVALTRALSGGLAVAPPADAPVEPTTEKATDLLVTLVACAGAVVVAYLVGTLISVLVRRLGRRSALWRDVSRRLRRPDRVILMIVAVWIAVRATTDPDKAWRAPVEHLLLIGLIVALAWWVGALAFVLEDSALSRYQVDTTDNRHARRVRTQITVIRRLTVSVIVVCAIAGVLLTFSAARAAGASLLASAGLISIIAGLAAQTSLANVFAGMQIVFTDAIRVDDVVVLEQEWGRIEEITLTYVVVHLWDDRRLILPSTYFTTTPYQNWTRRASQLLGTVEMDLDFRAPLGDMRAELERLLAASELWDHRVGILQVTDAVGGFAHVRALVSAPDAPSLFDLRCYVREGLVDWLQRSAPYALPQTRLLGAQDDGGVRTPEQAAATSPAAVPASTTAESTAAQPELPEPRGHAPHVPVVPPDVTPVGPRRTKGPVRVPALQQPARRAAARSSADTARDTDETMLLTRVSDPSQSALFTGSPEARERSRHFEGPGQDVIDERERTAEQPAVEADDDRSDAAGDSVHDSAAHPPRDPADETGRANRPE
ncbi:small-conductance mechanosensitive channel [Luteimicrobium subarcticum]|uniref:Small-conductance mechanosensitive channel n=1 Tax=Luteimicrobium subarcticum TaxID=620910 RepID=A0A2M8WSD6_9MICO|nr:small-conductance mechanosensitive channel [Luteimicrobium subarcticum]